MSGPLGVSRVTILGVQVDCLPRDQLIAQAIAWAKETERRTICYVNAHCLNLACEDEDYRSILNRAHLVYTDGIGAVWAGCLFGGRGLEKMTGRTWIGALCEQAAANGLRLYLLGGRPGVAQQARIALTQRIAGLNIVAARDGFFQELDEPAVLAEIAALRPHLVLVGMGVPLQEKWLALHRQQVDAPLCWAVGALLDMVAGAELPAPAWMNALALEWLWRLWVDPRGKWRRYMLGNPRFIFRLMRQLLARR